MEALSRRDRRLARLVSRHGPPPLWARPHGFATLVRIILEQQVSLASARALYRRLELEAARVTPDRVAALGAEGLRAAGFTRQKAAYVAALAERVLDGRLRLAALRRAPDEEVRARLLEVPGIGPWTADIYLLMALRRPDVWPPGDLALQRAVGRLEGLDAPVTAEAADEIAARWRPYRATAARILWHGYLAERRAPRAAPGSPER